MQYRIGSVNFTPPPFLLTFVGHLSSCWSRQWGICQKSTTRGGHLSIIIEGVSILPLRYFTSKYAYFDNYRFSVQIIFNPYALKIFVWFSLHYHPSPQYFLHPSKKLLPAIVISSHMEENDQCIV